MPPLLEDGDSKKHLGKRVVVCCCSGKPVGENKDVFQDRLEQGPLCRLGFEGKG